MNRIVPENKCMITIVDLDSNSEYYGQIKTYIGLFYPDMWDGNWCPEHQVYLISCVRVIDSPIQAVSEFVIPCNLN